MRKYHRRGWVFTPLFVWLCEQQPDAARSAGEVGNNPLGQCKYRVCLKNNNNGTRQDLKERLVTTPSDEASTVFVCKKQELAGWGKIRRKGCWQPPRTRQVLCLLSSQQELCKLKSLFAQQKLTTWKVKCFCFLHCTSAMKLRGFRSRDLV